MECKSIQKVNIRISYRYISRWFYCILLQLNWIKWIKWFSNVKFITFTQSNCLDYLAKCIQEFKCIIKEKIKINWILKYTFPFKQTVYLKWIITLLPLKPYETGKICFIKSLRKYILPRVFLSLKINLGWLVSFVFGTLWIYQFAANSCTEKKFVLPKLTA